MEFLHRLLKIDDKSKFEKLERTYQEILNNKFSDEEIEKFIREIRELDGKHTEPEWADRNRKIQIMKNVKIQLKKGIDILHHADYNIHNTENIINNLNVLEKLSETENCRGVEDINLADAQRFLNRITYIDNDSDYTVLKTLACNVRAFLQRHSSKLHSILKYDKTGFIEEENFSLFLKPASNTQPLSNTSVEGVTWLVGVPGSDGTVIPFSVLKNSTPIGSRTKNMIHELAVGKFLNRIRGLTPNMMFVYSGFICSPPYGGSSTQNIPGNYQKICSSVENMDFMSLSETVKNPTPLSEIFTDKYVTVENKLIIIRQILYTILIAQKFENSYFLHGDMHANNILVSILPEPVTLTYVLPSTQYDKPGENLTKKLTTKYVAKIIDYGFVGVTIFGKRLLQSRTKNFQPFMDGTLYEFGGIESILQGTFYPLADVVRFIASSSGFLKLLHDLEYLNLDKYESKGSVYKFSTIERRFRHIMSATIERVKNTIGGDDDIVKALINCLEDIRKPLSNIYENELSRELTEKLNNQARENRRLEQEKIEHMNRDQRKIEEDRRRMENEENERCRARIQQQQDIINENNQRMIREEQQRELERIRQRQLEEIEIQRIHNEMQERQRIHEEHAMRMRLEQERIAQEQIKLYQQEQLRIQQEQMERARIEYERYQLIMYHEYQKRVQYQQYLYQIELRRRMQLEAFNNQIMQLDFRLKNLNLFGNDELRDILRNQQDILNGEKAMEVDDVITYEDFVPMEGVMDDATVVPMEGIINHKDFVYDEAEAAKFRKKRIDEFDYKGGYRN